MTRRLLAAGILATIVFSSFPTHAATTKTITKYYESGSALWNRRNRPDPTCGAPAGPPCRLSNDGSIDVGGVEFPPVGGTGKLDMKVRVRDEHRPMGKVSISFCEDTNQSGTCSSDDRIWRNKCVGPNEWNTMPGVSRKNTVIVTVQVVYGCTQFVNDLPNNQMLSTRGAISLRYTLP